MMNLKTSRSSSRSGVVVKFVAALVVAISSHGGGMMIIPGATGQPRQECVQLPTAGMTPLPLEFPSAAKAEGGLDLSNFQSISTQRHGVYLDAYNQDYSRPYSATWTIEGGTGASAWGTNVSVSTRPANIVEVEDNTLQGSLTNLKFLDNPEVSAAAAEGSGVGFVVRVPLAASGGTPTFSEIKVAESYDNVHIRDGDTGLFLGRSASPKIEVTGYGSYVLIEKIRNVTNNWQLHVNCQDCYVQVIDCDPVVLFQNGGTVEIASGTNVAGGSKIYPERGTLIVRDGGILEQGIKIDEAYFTGILSYGCDDPGAKITLTEKGGCDKVEWHEKDDRVSCEEKDASELDALEMWDLGVGGCAAPYCEDYCAYTSSTNNNINHQHNCVPTEICQTSIKDAGRADPTKEDNCGGSSSSSSSMLFLARSSNNWTITMMMVSCLASLALSL